MSKLHYEQLLLGRYLWERVKATDFTNTEALNALGSITSHLQDAYEGKYYGFMWHLDLWIGLKPDVHDNWDEYGEGFKYDDTEYFEKSIQPPKITLTTATAPLHPELLMLGRYLWERINGVKQNDAESLKVLGDITAQLVKVYDENDSGFMRELQGWVKAKAKGEGDGQLFAERVRRDNAEYFIGLTVSTTTID